MSEESNIQRPLQKGETLKQFEIIKKLGHGGFGITYLALDKNQNKPVVIKEYFPRSIVYRGSRQATVSLLSSNHSRNYVAGKKRFEREALMLSKFKHPNIARVLLLFQENNTSYFVMDYIEGRSLADVQKSINRPFSESEIQKHCLPILNALELLHNQGLLHLDIKPANILSTTYGEPILIDFGGARIFSARESQDISQHTSMVYTDGFSPPEQYTKAIEQTPATDLYAFGMTLYALMTNTPGGELPKSIDRREILFNDFPDPLQPIRKVAPRYSRELLTLVDSCVNLKAKERPQNVTELKNKLTAQENIQDDKNIAKEETLSLSEDSQKLSPKESLEDANDEWQIASDGRCYRWDPVRGIVYKNNSDNENNPAIGIGSFYKLTNDWDKQLAITLFILGMLATFFYSASLHTIIISTLCLPYTIALATRKKYLGNGLGLVISITMLGFLYISGDSKVTGYVFISFLLFSHIWGLLDWKQFPNEIMSKKISSFKGVLITLIIVLIALGEWYMLGSLPNKQLTVIHLQLFKYEYISSAMLYYMYYIFALSFACGAQITMVMRYSFSWLLWGMLNCIWISIILSEAKYSLLPLAVVYLIICFVGYHAWSTNQQNES